MIALRVFFHLKMLSYNIALYEACFTNQDCSGVVTVGEGCLYLMPYYVVTYSDDDSLDC